MIAQPLSCPLQASLRFFQRPLPANLLASLTARCLCSQRGLPVYHVSYQHRWGWLRFRLFAGGAPSASADFIAPVPVPLPIRLRSGQALLVQACQHLWLVSSNDVYQRFSYLNHTTLSLLPTTLMLAVATAPHGLVTSPQAEATLSRRLRTPTASLQMVFPPTHAPVGYR